MRRLIIVAALLLTLALSSNAYAWTISGTLRQPFDPNQAWSGTQDTGFTDASPNGQIFMEYNTGFQKYHMAEDWNGKCLGGGSCDLGAPLYAIGDGFVRDVQINPIPDHGIGNSLIVRYTLPDGSQVDSVYWHVQSIDVSVGTNVQKGNKIATIGTGNGQYLAHLHWEIRKGTAGLNLSWHADSYMNPITVGTNGIANSYTSPSLFVDDRKTSNTYGLSSGSWTYFSVPSNAPSSTAYVEYNNGRYSLKRAVDNNLIWQYMYVQINGTWYYYPDITKVLFSPGNTYAIYGFVPNANLFILTPGHTYQKDRAKIDMIRAVSGNGNFKSVQPDLFAPYSSDQSFDYWKMPFTYNNGSGNQIVYANQATLKSNPIVRYTAYYDPAIASWTPWVAVDQNTLY